MEGPVTAFETVRLSAEYDVLAPDGSEIRVLPSTTRGSMAHGTLPPGCVSRAIVHRTVEELWYVLDGEGELWRRQGEREDVVRLEAGVALSIPTGTHFQFRTTGTAPLRFIMVTMPPWPGEREAMRVLDHWPLAKPSRDGEPREGDD